MSRRQRDASIVRALARVTRAQPTSDVEKVKTREVGVPAKWW
jgi:hypothetical protein